MPVIGTIAHWLAVVAPLLMMVAKAVAEPPPEIDRLDGSTAATSGLELVFCGSIRPIFAGTMGEVFPVSVNQMAPSGPTVRLGVSVLVVGIAN